MAHALNDPALAAAWASAAQPTGYTVPMVLEQSSRGDRAFDIFSLLLRNRIIFLGSEVNDTIANLIVAQLLYLQQEDPEREIQLYINSPGGSSDAGLAIYDTMQLIANPVSTTCIGMAASMGAWLLARRRQGQAHRLAELAHLDPPGIVGIPGNGG